MRNPTMAPSGGWFTRFFSVWAEEIPRATSTRMTTWNVSFFDTMGHLSESCAEPRFSACSVPRGERSAGAQSYQVLGSREEKKTDQLGLLCYDVSAVHLPGWKSRIPCTATQCNAGERLGLYPVVRRRAVG